MLASYYHINLQTALTQQLRNQMITFTFSTLSKSESVERFFHDEIFLLTPCWLLLFQVPTLPDDLGREVQRQRDWRRLRRVQDRRRDDRRSPPEKYNGGQEGRRGITRLRFENLCCDSYHPTSPLTPSSVSSSEQNQERKLSNKIESTKRINSPCEMLSSAFSCKIILIL